MKQYLICIVLIQVFLYACGTSVPKSNDSGVAPRIEFDYTNSSSSTGTLNFSSTVTSTSPITEITLWIEINGRYLKQYTQNLNTLSNTEYLSNTGLEDYNSTIVGDVASYFNISESLNASVSTSVGTGRVGSAQKINVASSGDMGISISQNISLEANEQYMWTFWYKTDGAEPIYADISDNELGNTNASHGFAGTSGAWSQATIYYTHSDNVQNPKIRILSFNTQTIWIDDSSLKNVIEISNLTQVDFNTSLDLPAGTYNWYLEATNAYRTDHSQLFVATL